MAEGMARPWILTTSLRRSHVDTVPVAAQCFLDVTQEVIVLE